MFHKVCICLSILSACVGLGEKIVVHVASESPQKIAAAKQAFEYSFPKDEILIKSSPSNSGVPAQPWGYSSGIRGAQNRLIDALNTRDELVDYTVSFENYVEEEAHGVWADRAVVLLQKRGEEDHRIVLSQETEIPEEIVRLSQKMSSNLSEEGWSTTVGEVISHVGKKGIDPSDWHKEIEFGGVSRVDLLAEALFQAIHFDEIQLLNAHIALFEDFPKPGILFKDFSPILNNAEAFKTCIDLLAKRYRHKGVDVIVGLESRGFILGAALAHTLGVGFVPVRKAGKIPGPVYSVQYEKEYGFDTFAISQSGLQPGARVLVIDDLIATGGSAKAAIELIKQAGGEPVEFASILEVRCLKGRSKLGVPTFNLLHTAPFSFSE